MGAIAATATRTLQGFEPQNISNVVWSFATAGIPAPDLFRAVAATLVEDSRRNTPRWRRMTAQVMANIVWAYATANNDPGPELFEVLGAAAMGCLGTFDPQNLANFAWAYATVERASPQLFGALAQASLHRLDDFVAEGLSSTAWAYAKAGIQAPALFEAIAECAQAKIAGFNNQAMANIAWAFSTAEVIAPTLFDQIAIWSISRLDEMNPQDLSNLCYAFSSAHRAAPRLFDGIAEAAVRRGLLSEFNPQDLSNTAFAYATVGHSSPELFAAIADAARHQLGRFTAQGFANTLWSYCVLGTEAPALFDAAADVLPDLLETLAGDTGFSAMMYQLFLFLQIEAPHPRLLMALAEYRDVWLGAFANAEVNASESQRDVSHALTALGWAHEVEYRTEDGLSLDMAQPSTKIAVEFDGPHHFNWGPEGPIFDGRTAFKRRLLAKLGWRVISVSHFDWDGRDGWTREAHLREHVLAATSMGLAPQN
jgi:hypothetical protein